MKKQKFYKTIVIPTDLACKIESCNLSKAGTNKMFHLVDLMMKYSNRNTGVFYSYQTLSNSFLRKLFSGHYMQVIQPLLSKGIIERDGFYSKEFSKSYYYRVKPVFFEACNSTVNITVSYRQHLTDDSGLFLFEKFKDFMGELKIPFEKLEQITNEQVEKISIHNCRLNSEVRLNDKNTLFVFDGHSSYYIKKQKAIQKAKKANKLLIQDDKSTYIMTAKQYCQMKKLNIKISYQYVLSNLKNKNYYAKRNTTNNRLDHNITNMPKVLLSEILKANDLIEFDFVSSQPTIAANQMKAKGIKSKFIDDTLEGKLYENIQKVLDLESRDDAKVAFLRICYMNGNYKSIQKDKLTCEYPELIAYADKVKALKGHNQYAIDLQKSEARIFIDNILLKLLDVGYNILSKHDSIICKTDDAKQVSNYMTQIISGLDFEGTLKAS